MTGSNDNIQDVVQRAQALLGPDQKLSVYFLTPHLAPWDKLGKLDVPDNIKLRNAAFPDPGTEPQVRYEGIV